MFEVDAFVIRGHEKVIGKPHLRYSARSEMERQRFDWSALHLGGASSVNRERLFLPRGVGYLIVAAAVTKKHQGHKAAADYERKEGSETERWRSIVRPALPFRSVGIRLGLSRLRAAYRIGCSVIFAFFQSLEQFTVPCDTVCYFESSAPK